jgi:hypothetical protein
LRDFRGRSILVDFKKINKKSLPTDPNFEDHAIGNTKPGKVGDFFALVSMKSPNFCQKAKFYSIFSCPYFFPPIIVLFLQYSHRRNSHVPEI